MNKAILLAGGNIADLEIIKEYLDNETALICVDRGCDFALKYNLEIHIAIGDFDSINKTNYKKIVEKKVEQLTFNADKDETDMQLALDYCYKSDFKKVYIFGALGTRLDHSMANIHFLHSYHDKFDELSIIDDNNIIFLLEGETKLANKKGYNISFTYAFGRPLLTLTGVKWPLNKHEVIFGDSLTISNLIIDEFAYAKVENGRCFCFYSKD